MPPPSATPVAVWLLASLIPTAVAAQSPRDGATAPPDETAAPTTSLERIRRGLELERGTFAPALGRLDFRDPTLVLESRSAIQVTPGLGFVGGVTLLRTTDGGGVVPMGGPTHATMLAAMTPLDFRQAASTDVLGIATASAFAIAPRAVIAMVNWLRGDEVDLTVPVLSEGDKTTVLAATQAGTEVLHAGIEQGGKTVELSLVVPDETPPERAQRLGRRFLWLVKATSAVEQEPDLLPGAGNFDYVVRVSSESNTVLAQGGKTTTQTNITW